MAPLFSESKQIKTKSGNLVITETVFPNSYLHEYLRQFQYVHFKAKY